MILDLDVIFNLFNLGVFVKVYAKIIRDACELFVSNFDCAIRKQVDFIFNKYPIKLINKIIKEGSLNLCPIRVD
jgi:hypothetical protein